MVKFGIYALQSVLSGYNGTIMAYGQTGTGKTYTVGNLGRDDTSERGIMVRAMEDILTSTSPECDVVEFSFLQVGQFFMVQSSSINPTLTFIYLLWET